VTYNPLPYVHRPVIIVLGGACLENGYLIVFGNRLRDIRKSLGLSQEKFALLIGMDRTYYSSVEAGKRNISLLNIKKIADGFHVPVSTLFDDKQDT